MVGEPELFILSKKKITLFEGYAKVSGRDIPLSSNEIRLLKYCRDGERWLSQIARYLEIDVKNVSTKIAKLEEIGLIDIDKHGTNKKFVKTKIRIPPEVYV